MTFTGITVTASGAIAQKAGAYFNTDYTDDMMTVALLQAESSLNADTENNWSDQFGTLNADTKGIVSAITSSTVAIEAIRFDLDAIGRSSSIAMINSLSNEINANKKILLEKSKRDFVREA